MIFWYRMKSKGVVAADPNVYHELWKNQHGGKKRVKKGSGKETVTKGSGKKRVISTHQSSL